MMTHTRLVELLIQATKDGDIEWGLVTSDMKPLTITGAELLQHFEARIMGVYVTLFPRVAEYPIGSGNRKLALALVAMGVPGNGRLTTNNALIPGVETPARMAMLILYLSVRREWVRRNQQIRYTTEYRRKDIRSGLYLDKIVPEGWNAGILLSALS